MSFYVPSLYLYDMNNNILWEEKNSTEQKKNSVNKNELETYDIIKSMEIKSKRNVCEDIGNKKIWNKICPKCKKEQRYSSIIYLREAIRNNTLCLSCVGKVRKFSKKTKKKMSKSGKIKTFSEKHRQHLSRSMFGNKNHFYGKKHSKNTRRKIRISLLKRLNKLGIGTKIDRGSREWFRKYNKENKTNYRPRRFLDIGYDADGYDKKLHSWIEYDSLYHRMPSQHKEDIIRQNNIMNYYKSIGKPLNKFIRVITWNNNEIRNII